MLVAPGLEGSRGDYSIDWLTPLPALSYFCLLQFGFFLREQANGRCRGHSAQCKEDALLFAHAFI